MRSALDAAAQLAAERAIDPAIGRVMPSRGGGFRPDLQDPKVAEQLNSYRNNVYKAVRFLSNEIAALPRTVVRVSFEEKDGKRTERRDEQPANPITRIFAKGARGQPNPWTTSGNSLALIVLDMGLAGNHYALKVRRSENGEVRWLLRLRPDWVKVIPDELNVGIEGYAFRPGGTLGRATNFMASEVLHVKTPSPVDDRIGWSPLQAMRLSVDTDEEIRRFNMQFFEQGARIDGVVEGVTTDEQVEEVYDLLRTSHYTGVEGAWLPLVLPMGLKFTATQQTAKDFEFAALAGFTEDDILEAYGVPRGLLGNVKDVSLANLRGLMTIAAKNGIEPLARTIEEHVELSLLNREEFPGQSDTAFLEFDFDDPTPGDPDQERKWMESRLKGLVTSPNEERAEMGRDEASWGALPWANMNLVQVGTGEDGDGDGNGEGEGGGDGGSIGVGE